MKSKMHLKKSFMNPPFRCAVSALMASIPGGIIAIRTALAEESDAGTKVVEEVIDTVDATTAVADTENATDCFAEMILTITQSDHIITNDS